MAESNDWEFPDPLRPRQEDVQFDLDAAFNALVLLRAEVPEDAFTAEVLGTERVGNGVVIEADGRKVVLTIGYLITEAQSIWLTTNTGQVVAGHPLAYDQTTGFGLVLPLGRVDVPSLQRGSAAALSLDSKVFVIGHGGAPHSLQAHVIARREFTGYWEYLLDDALFTAPPHPQWGGTALLDAKGRLVGIGSLLVQEAVSGETFDANMFVPIDLLEPILADMVQFGRPAHPARPWLGMYATESDDQLVVAGLTENGPAHRAGVRSGDVIAEVAGRRVSSLGEMFRTVWATGPAGTEIPLKLARKNRIMSVTVRSGSREDFLKKPQRH